MVRVAVLGSDKGGQQTMADHVAFCLHLPVQNRFQPGVKSGLSC